MSGTMIDLMPTAIRRRARAGQRMRRFGGLGVLVLGVIVTFATHSQLRRDRLDEDLVIAQARAAQAIAEGRFDKSLITVKNPDGTVALDHEEFPRPETTKEGLSELKTVFSVVRDVPVDEAGTTYGALIQQKYPEITEFNHIHHAGNSSGIVDGSAAILLGNKEFGARYGIKPRALIRSTAKIGTDPTIMLTGPIPVTEKILKHTGMEIGDIDLFEVNEAFASVVLRFEQAFNVSHDKVNVNGGSIAMGHPLGATGAMILGTLVDELERGDKETGLVTLCIGSGMGAATIIERV